MTLGIPLYYCIDVCIYQSVTEYSYYKIMDSNTTLCKYLLPLFLYFYHYVVADWKHIIIMSGASEADASEPLNIMSICFLFWCKNSFVSLISISVLFWITGYSNIM